MMSFTLIKKLIIPLDFSCNLAGQNATTSSCFLYFEFGLNFFSLTILGNKKKLEF